ncbi:hypothetical protein F6J84_11225 [Microbacterium caowuchunii]|uniref:hypothetical protein n=1 Tax=Microbacterium caowuchunii TaxID=2614638 RepID=UPI001243EB22|nr:hypothetical protein [Microbacterium caowuchunii]QEW00609.1 hypothetical protein F6J84_11225 [Microbacterium caowuchunii]
MGHIAKSTVVIAVVTLGFISILMSIAFRWPASQWIVPIACVVLVIGLLAGLVRYLPRRTRRSRRPSAELSASDGYSDLELGRPPITNYPRDEASTSQIGDPPPHRPPSP